jgi:hypothetical protein
MSFGSNGVDRARSLQKVQTQLCLAYLCVNGTSLASFALTFVQEGNGPKCPQNMSFWSNGVDQLLSLRKKAIATSFSELVR